MKAALLWLALVLAIALPAGANAHALEPGYLEIAPTGAAADEWSVTFRKPQASGRPMGIDAELPESCTPRRGPPPRFDGRAFVTGWIARCTRPIWQGDVHVDGLAQTATDVLVRFTPEPGARAQTIRMTPDFDRIALPPVPTRFGVLASYFSLGLDHILGGLDHLLFVFALLLLVSDVRKLVWSITAFTMAHSITLTLAALGWVMLPVPPVEAVIALSIVFLASEIVRPQDTDASLMQRSPWVVAFAFGLLHGLGFASALRDIGLPESDVLIALFSFNLGVEAGQLLFVSGVLGLLALCRRIAPRAVARQVAPGSRALTLAAYGIGGTASFWTLDRVLSFLS